MAKIFTVILLTCSLSGYGMIRLPGIISDNMVMEQHSDVRIWGWGEPYEKVSVTTSWDHKTYPPVVVDGNARWELTIHTPAAGGPYTLDIEGKNHLTVKNILIGEVWLCSGQSNMEMCANWGLKDAQAALPRSHCPEIRFFQVPKRTASVPQQQIEGRWVICDSATLAPFSAVGYFFGRTLYQRLACPVGLIESAWGGTSAEVWSPDSMITHDPILQRAAGKIVPNGQCPNLPGYAFNAMIAPLIPYKIAGVIWYQGENNTVNAGSYARLFTRMMDSWRSGWGYDLPFYFVQIAPYHYGQPYVGALLREAQAASARLPHTGMVVITDLVDDTSNVHPADKHDVGLRLANRALSETYHVGGIAYQSPVFKAMTIRNHQAWVTFQHGEEGLTVKGGQVRELFIAGEDQIFYPAEARIKDDMLIVWSDRVPRPVAVRYGFSNTGIGNLFGKNGLPVGPFRSDHWEVVVPR
ncbi:sialate O-acetylesterase [Compostibacter hankyongensis]|uniref:Sialate O-acetylesterase n=1 Tax=Compostibacter hankyongensis TaxID=1007089 RepID=A0ABP8G2H2_9BACT